MDDYISGLDESNERYQAFIHNSTEGIWRFELDVPVSTKLSVKKQIQLVFDHAYLAEANHAFARMYGVENLETLIGAKLTDFMPSNDPENIAYIKAFIKSGYSLSGVESHETTPDGEDRYMRNSLVGIIENDAIARAWGTQTDVTEQRKANNELIRSQQRLTLALQSSSMGLWEWDIVKDTLYWSNELKSLYGLNIDEVVTLQKYQWLIHPEDREATWKTIQRYMLSGDTYQIEHRILWQSGETHWVLSKGQAYFEDGKVVRMIGTSTNIDEAKQANELEDAYNLLKKQRTQLLELNKTKDEFIALASHQLRTPATAVKQYIGLLFEDFAGPLTADQTQFLQVAYDSNERQLRIINDLLKTAQIDSRKYVLDKKKQNIADTVHAAIDDLADLFDSRKQTVKTEGLIDLTLDIDASEVKLVLINLLENASKYSYPGSRIRIVMKKDDILHLSVIDTGVGIARNDTKRIFDKFTRVNNDLSDTVTGTGFGLYWVKRLVELHGGTIKVKSKTGKGSEFVIGLPYE